MFNLIQEKLCMRGWYFPQTYNEGEMLSSKDIALQSLFFVVFFFLNYLHFFPFSKSQAIF